MFCDRYHKPLIICCYQPMILANQGYITIRKPSHEIRSNPAQTEKLLTPNHFFRFNEVTQLVDDDLKSIIIPCGRSNLVNGIKLICDNIVAIPIDTYPLLNRIFNALRVTGIDGTDTANTFNPDIKAYAQLLLTICLYSTQNNLLAELMINPVPLAQRGSSSTVQHGQYFVEIFGHRLFEHMIKTVNDGLIDNLAQHLNAATLLTICKIYIDLLKYTFRHKKTPQTCLAITKAILAFWPNFEMLQDPAATITTFTLVELMGNIALIYPKKLPLNHGPIEQWVLQIIVSSGPLELKAQAILLLPCLIDESDRQHDGIRNALAVLQNAHFPVKSSEFVAGSLARSLYVKVIQAVLHALVMCRSVVVLQFLVNVTAADPKHILEYDIEESLIAYLKSLDVAQQGPVMMLPFTMFKDTGLDPSIRQLLLRRFLLPMIRHCHLASVINFYTNNMKEIVDMVETNYAVASFGYAVEQGLVNRIGAYQLIEALFAAVPFERIKDRTQYIGIHLTGKSLVCNSF